MTDDRNLWQEAFEALDAVSDAAKERACSKYGFDTWEEFWMWATGDETSKDFIAMNAEAFAELELEDRVGR